jgi:hypothetical protein
MHTHTNEIYIIKGKCAWCEWISLWYPSATSPKIESKSCFGLAWLNLLNTQYLICELIWYYSLIRLYLETPTRTLLRISFHSYNSQNPFHQSIFPPDTNNTDKIIYNFLMIILMHMKHKCILLYTSLLVKVHAIWTYRKGIKNVWIYVKAIEYHSHWAFYLYCFTCFLMSTLMLIQTSIILK